MEKLLTVLVESEAGMEIAQEWLRIEWIRLWVAIVGIVVVLSLLAVAILLDLIR